MSRTVSPETTARILTSVLSLLSEVGYHAASMEALAARAATSKAALYRRWPTKPELIMAAVRSTLNTANPVHPHTEEPRDDLRVMLRNLVPALQESAYGGAVRVLVGAAQSEPLLAKAIADVERERRWILAEPLRRMGVAESSLELEIDLLLSPLYFRLIVRRVTVTVQFVDEVCERLWPRATHSKSQSTTEGGHP